MTKKEILFEDFPDIGKITEDEKKKNANKVFVESVRLANGLYRADEQHEEYRKVSLKRKLP